MISLIGAGAAVGAREPRGQRLPAGLLYISICMCVYMCVYIYIYIYIYTHTYIYTHVHIHLYTYSIYERSVHIRLHASASH